MEMTQSASKREEFQRLFEEAAEAAIKEAVGEKEMHSKACYVSSFFPESGEILKPRKIFEGAQ